MRRIFLNVEHEIFFNRNGYIKLPFDNVAEIDRIRELVLSLQPSDNFNAYQKNQLHQQDFHCTFLDTNKEYRSKIFDIVTSFFNSSNKSFLHDYCFVQANVFIKPPKKGYVAPHQNLTVLDESKFSSLSFWCPALNTNVSNGTMVVVPGSHKKFMKYRTTNISWPLLPMFQDYNSPFFKTIDVQKGELLIIDDSLIHGTTTNQTDDSRFVFHALLAPAEAGLLFCDIDIVKRTVKRYRASSAFWQQYLPGSSPTHLPLVDELNYNEGGLTLEEFKAELHGQVL